MDTVAFATLPPELIHAVLACIPLERAHALLACPHTRTWYRHAQHEVRLAHLRRAQLDTLWQRVLRRGATLRLPYVRCLTLRTWAPRILHALALPSLEHLHIAVLGHEHVSLFRYVGRMVPQLRHVHIEHLRLGEDGAAFTPRHYEHTGERVPALHLHIGRVSGGFAARALAFAGVRFVRAITLSDLGLGDIACLAFVHWAALRATGTVTVRSAQGAPLATFALADTQRVCGRVVAELSPDRRYVLEVQCGESEERREI